MTTYISLGLLATWGLRYTEEYHPNLTEQAPMPKEKYEALRKKVWGPDSTANLKDPLWWMGQPKPRTQEEGVINV